MSDLRKAAEMALEVLENPWKAKPEGVADVIIALRQALSEQEPEAWLVLSKDNSSLSLYAPKREWVGLDGEIPGLGLVTEEFYNGMLFAEDILREKNT